jgi:hypothetical protein
VIFEDLHLGILTTDGDGRSDGLTTKDLCHNREGSSKLEELGKAEGQLWQHTALIDCLAQIGATQSDSL